MNHLLGAHTSTSGGVASAVELANKLGFTAMQIFSKNNNRWFQRPFTEKEIDEFKTNLKKSNIKFVCVHDSYLINLCATNLDFKTKSDKAFIDEIERCMQLGIEYLNFHPGAHCGAGKETGIKIIAESLNIAHEKTKGYKVSSMLEATAGQGSAVGYRFEQLREIIDRVEDKKRISVCIDTAHIFAAGYELRTMEGYDKTIKDFDEIIGLKRLKCIHMNDSKKPLGSRVDRHDHIGKGLIGLDGFRNIMNDIRIEHVPKIAALEEFLEGVGEAAARTRPIDGEWTIQEVVDHLVETHRPSVRELRELLAGQRPAGGPIPAGLQSRDPLARPWPELLGELKTLQAEVVAALGAAPDSLNDARAPVVMVINVKAPDGRETPLHWIEELDWKAYAIVFRLHVLDHLNQAKKVLKAIEAT